MDALIPILFAIAYFIFQAYTGYQKEQEKAAKRNIGKPNPEVYKPETPDYPVQRDVTPYDPARSQGPAYEKPAYEKATYGKPAYEKPAYEKTDYQTRNIENPTCRAIRSRPMNLLTNQKNTCRQSGPSVY